MAGKTDALEQRLLDHLFKGGGTPALSALSTVYIALCTDGNTDVQRDGGTFSEVSGGGYTRATCASSVFTRSGTAPAQIANNATIAFPTATGNWGTITCFYIADAASSGNVLYWGTIANIPVNTGDTPQFAAGALVVTED